MSIGCCDRCCRGCPTAPAARISNSPSPSRRQRALKPTASARPAIPRAADQVDSPGSRRAGSARSGCADGRSSCCRPDSDATAAGSCRGRPVEHGNRLDAVDERAAPALPRSRRRCFDDIRRSRASAGRTALNAASARGPRRSRSCAQSARRGKARRIARQRSPSRRSTSRAARRARRRCAAARPARCASSRRRRAARPCGRATAAGCRARRSRARCASSGSSRASAADPQRALEGQRAAEAEPEAEPDEHVGLLLAAVEGVRDAAAAPRSGAAASARCRPRGGTCSITGSSNSRASCSCAAKKRSCRAAVEPRRRSGRGRSRRPRPAAGRRGAPRARRAARSRSASAARADRTADGCRARRRAVPMRQRAHRVEVGRRRPPAGRSAPTPAARARADDGVAIGVELGGVEVAMGVDPHARDDACAPPMPARRDRSCAACYCASARGRASLRPLVPARSPRPGCRR